MTEPANVDALDGYGLPDVVDDPASVPTPHVVVDGPTVDRNIARLMASASARGLAVRPHIKTHKSRFVAARQLAAGAIGLTVAKVGEALAMEAVDLSRPEDLLIAYPIVQRPVADRLARLAGRVGGRGGTVRVAIDSAAAADVVADAAREHGVTVGLLIELDTGNRRTGLGTVDRVADLSAHIDRLPGVRLDGVMLFPGHIRGTEAEQRAALDAEAEFVGRVLELSPFAGPRPPIVSGGSTPTQETAHRDGHLTEIRPGTSVYNDANTVRGGYCGLADCATVVVTTVVSTSVPGRVVVDAGSKTLTSDRNGPAPESGFGIVRDHPDAVVAAVYEEHGLIDWPAGAERPPVGARLAIVPNHVCPCVNLHDVFWWREADGTLVRRPVDARGAVV